MKENRRKVLRIVCALILIGCLGYIAYYYGTKAANEKVYEDAKDKVKVEKPKPEQPKEEVKEEIPIDFAEWQGVNPDVYAWIQIPGTNVNYPILQSATDDVYYLDHTIEGKEGYPGSIYTESINSKDFSDFNTVIYGHDMKDGSMFKHLHKYEDMNFLLENEYVVIYTPEKKLTYRIFAALEYDDRHIINTYGFLTDESKQQFLDSIYGARSMTKNIRDDVTVGPSDHILTMSTCIASKPDKRFIVGAVQIHE